MTESEIISAIRREIKQQLNIILSGVSENSTNPDGNSVEDIQNMFPTMMAITKRPVMHPYGFASLAPDGTTQVIARQGDHFGNRIVLGHRDADRPTFLNQGDVILYNEFGQQIYMQDGKIQIGSNSASEPLVLGNVLSDFMGQLITLLNTFLQTVITGPIAVSTLPGNSAPTNPVVIAALTTLVTQLMTLQTQFLTAPATNILSQESFTERMNTP